MKNILKTFWQIVFKEITVFRKVFVSKFIDLLIIVLTNIIVFAFLMPSFGLKSTYGAFIVIGLIPAVSLFDAIPRTTNMVMDITGNKKISYLLTLPIPSALAIAAIAVGWAANSAMFSILILPVAKILLYNKFSLSQFSFFKFIISFVSFQLMLGFFSLFLSSLIKDMKYISWIWARVVNPLFMLGGYFYTWKSIYSLNHIAGLANLANPIMIAAESIRGAVLGPEGYLPFWFTILALYIFMFIFASIGIIKIKKRLDCV